MKIYTGLKDERFEDQIVFVCSDDETVKPYELKNTTTFSPAGFSWGHRGSGPAALAHSILADYFKTDGISADIYEMFKHDFIELAGDELRITSNDIIDWMTTKAWDIMLKEKHGKRHTKS